MAYFAYIWDIIPTALMVIAIIYLSKRSEKLEKKIEELSERLEIIEHKESITKAFDNLCDEIETKLNIPKNN